MGVSVEDERVTDRIDLLRKTGARIKFLSCEPLIGPLHDLDLRGMDWVIVGGESGRKPRPMQPEWVQDIKNQCQVADVAFFFKQWGGTNKKKAGRELDGRTYNEMPHTQTAQMDCML
jgi:protein gp37